MDATHPPPFKVKKGDFFIGIDLGGKEKKSVCKIKIKEKLW